MGKDNELMTAVKEANLQNVRKILQKHRRSHKKNSHKKPIINNADADGFTVLHHAALFGDVEIVMAIVEMEGDPNSTDNKGMTPLHMAAWAGKEGTVKALLEHRSLPNLPSHNGDTPLHLAAQHGYASCTKVLLSFHADGSFRNDNKETPLDLACQFGHTAVVKQLITDDKVKHMLMSPMTDQRYKSPLHLSAKSGHDDIVHLLLQGGAKVNESRQEGTPLHQAALYGKTNVVRLLLRAGADASVKNRNGLMALDLVNRFTTSRAGLEIKQMLREAAGDRVEYGRAVSDYNNQYDDTSLSFKVGDTIAVIEQNEDGRWKGYVVNSELENVGFFPAMVVQLVAKKKKTHSTCSTSSQASVDSGMSGDGSSYPPSNASSPDKVSNAAPPGSPRFQPVGIVPIGSFEVVTLAQANPDSHATPKQTANGSFPPRMSSFKQKKAARQSSSSSSSPKSSCTNQKRNSQPMEKQYQTNTEQVKQMLMQRSKSEDRSRLKVDNTGLNIDPNVLNRLSPMTSPGQSPTLTTKAAQHEFAKALMQQQQQQQQQHNQQQYQQQQIQQQIQQEFNGVKRPPTNAGTIYADVEVVHGKSPPDKSPPHHTTNYNTMYFSDGDGGINKDSTASNTDNESVTSNTSTSCDNRSTHRIKPILVKSRSIDSSKTSDTEGSVKNGNSVKFANASPEEIRQHRPMEPINIFPPDHTLQCNNTLNRPPNMRSFSLSVMEKGPQNNCLTIKRSPTHKTDMNTNGSFPFSAAFTSSSPGSTNGNVSPRQNGSPNILRPCSSPQMRESWSSSKTSESSSPKMPGSPLSLNHFSDSCYSSRTPSFDPSISPRIPDFDPTLTPHTPQTPQTPGFDFNLSPMTPVDDNVKFPSNGELNEDEQKVLDWLIDLKLASYFYNFQSHGYDMISIRAITPEDLNIMDIKKTGHRKKLLSEIAKLPPSNELPRIKPDDVGSWLARLNLEEYEQNFIEGGFDDIDFLKDLDKNDLDMIDIKKKGHQKKILMAVQQLSDLELTAILDEVVAETPRRGLSVNGRSYSDQILQEFFPSNFPNINIASHVSQSHGMYNNSTSGGSLSDHSPPQRSPSTPVKQKVPPPLGHRTSNGVAPKPKLKPKPIRSNSTTNGYYSRSSSESLNDSGTLGNSALNSSGEIQGDQDEVVSSSKSRNFFREQERKASLSSQEGLDRKPSLTSLSSFDGSPTNTIRRNGSVVKAPVIKQKPISIPENENVFLPNTPTTPKPPPPAPPKRSDSIKNGLTETENGVLINGINGINGHHSDEAPALPLKSKSRSSDNVSPTSLNYPSPPAGFQSPVNNSYPNNISIVPPPPTEINGNFFVDSLKKKNSIDEAFGSTDDLLNDLMADIDDFSAQLDAMF